MKYLLTLAGLVLTSTAIATPGYWQKQMTDTVVAPPTPTAMAVYLPDQGQFTMPADWGGAMAWRISSAQACGGNKDCVGSNQYNYWPDMNNSAGRGYAWVVVNLASNKGGHGPTLFKLDKNTGKITKVGPVFSDVHLQAMNASVYGFSYTKPDIMYYWRKSGRFMQINVVTGEKTLVFDSNDYQNQTAIIKGSYSADDQTFSAILETGQHTGDPWQRLGCIVYHKDTGKFHTFTKNHWTHQCTLDKSGKWVIFSPHQLLKQECPGDRQRQASVVGNTDTGEMRVLCDQDGGGGHHDTGYGWWVQADNWGPHHNTFRLWKLSQPLVHGQTLPGGGIQGAIVYGQPSWDISNPSHVSWDNATTADVHSQYVCGSGGISTNPDPDRGAPVRNGAIVCFNLQPGSDADRKVLVLGNSGSYYRADGCTHPNGSYGVQPKGNIDPTGHYYYYTSNHGSDRCDAFVVKIPVDKLTSAPPPGTTPVPPPSSTPAPPPASQPWPGGKITVPKYWGRCSVSQAYQDQYGNWHIRLDCRIEK